MDGNNGRNRRCAFQREGVVTYEHGLELQETARGLVEKGEWDGILLLLEHAPVITVGSGGGLEHLRTDADTLAGRGIAVLRSERGGNITCHNPGQLVGYPVLNLSLWRRDLSWYRESLEETLIRTLARFGIVSGRKARYNGVWVEDSKIAAIGVTVRNWITKHGFALNVQNDLALFQDIVPCGIRDYGVTSLVETAGRPMGMDETAAALVEEFSFVFRCAVRELQ